MIHVLGDEVNIDVPTRVIRWNHDCTQFLELIEQRLVNPASHKLPVGLDELLNAVNPVAFRHVDGIQQRNDNLKRAKPGLIRRVFDAGDSENLLFAANHSPGIPHLKIPVLRPAGEYDRAVLFLDVSNTHHGLVTQPDRVDHKRIPWVQREDFKRGFIRFDVCECIRKYHSVCCTADIPPIDKLLVLCGLILRKHIIVQGQNLGGNALIPASAHILDGFPNLVSCFEGDDFVRPVLNDHVIDFRPNVLFPV